MFIPSFSSSRAKRGPKAQLLALFMILISMSPLSPAFGLECRVCEPAETGDELVTSCTSCSPQQEAVLESMQALIATTGAVNYADLMELVSFTLIQNFDFAGAFYTEGGVYLSDAHITQIINSGDGSLLILLSHAFVHELSHFEYDEILGNHADDPVSRALDELYAFSVQLDFIETYLVPWLEQYPLSGLEDIIQELDEARDRVELTIQALEGVIGVLSGVCSPDLPAEPCELLLLVFQTYAYIFDPAWALEQILAGSLYIPSHILLDLRDLLVAVVLECRNNPGNCNTETLLDLLREILSELLLRDDMTEEEYLEYLEWLIEIGVLTPEQAQEICEDTAVEEDSCNFGPDPTPTPVPTPSPDKNPPPANESPAEEEDAEEGNGGASTEGGEAAPGSKPAA